MQEASMKLTQLGTKLHIQMVVAFTLISVATSSTAIAFEFSRKLVSPIGTEYDQFGYSVALSGNNALVGRYLSFPPRSRVVSQLSVANESESPPPTYLFDTTTGSLLHTLTPPNEDTYFRFGSSVAVSRDMAIVSNHFGTGKVSESGSAYVYDTTTGTRIRKLEAPDGVRLDYFGYDLALSGNLALVGSPRDDDFGSDSGSAYLFDAATGQMLQKLRAPDGSEGDEFGTSVALSDDFALVGSHLDDENGFNSGSAYLYDTTTGDLLHKLTAPDGEGAGWFGRSVAVTGDYALVGRSSGRPGAGSAYLFDTTTGDLLHEFTAPNGRDEDKFGFSVALSGDQALIGSYRGEGTSISSGAAYLFDTTTGNLLRKLTAPDVTQGFGYSVGLSGDTAFLGSPFDDNMAAIQARPTYSPCPNQPPACFACSAY